jgi:hypothetical protein
LRLEEKLPQAAIFVVQIRNADKSAVRGESCAETKPKCAVNRNEVPCKLRSYHRLVRRPLYRRSPQPINWIASAVRVYLIKGAAALPYPRRVNIISTSFAQSAAEKPKRSPPANFAVAHVGERSAQLWVVVSVSRETAELMNTNAADL